VFLCDLTHILSDLYAEIMELFHNTPAEDVSAQNKKTSIEKPDILFTYTSIISSCSLFAGEGLNILTFIVIIL
jgi:hypothetical protein